MLSLIPPIHTWLWDSVKETGKWAGATMAFSVGGVTIPSVLIFKVLIPFLKRKIKETK